MLKTQNMELTLEAKSLKMPGSLGMGDNETGTDIERKDALVVHENPQWNRSRDIIPITNQQKRTQQQCHIIYEH